MKKIRLIFYLVAAFATIIALYLSFHIQSYQYAQNLVSGTQGGAAGFAILAGLALVAASITYLRKEDG